MPAAIYARQSIEKADSVSIDAQVERCKSICNLNGWEYTVYTDSGFSGKNINRPNFERLLSDIKSGKINAVVSYKLDRISRSIVDFAGLLQMFEQNGVQYISATEQFDTSSPVGRAMIYIVMVFAQLERETITQRITDNYRYRAAMGLFMGGKEPLGYTSRHIIYNGKRASILQINENVAPLVRRIFDLYLNGQNTHQIAHLLNSENIPTSTGKTWVNNTVLRILRNIDYCRNEPELYEYLVSRGYGLSCGLSSFDGQHGMCAFFKSHDRHIANDITDYLVTVGQHEPLISARDWILIQRKLDITSELPKKAKKSKRSWLAGLLKCADCGHSFGLKTTNKSGNTYQYYFCRGRAARGHSTCQNDLWLSDAELSSLIEKRMLRHTSDKLKSPPKKKTAYSENKQVAELKQNLADRRLKINNAVENLGRGNAVVDDHLTKYISDLDHECRQLESQINRIEVEAYTARPAELDAPALQKAYDSMKLAFSGGTIEDRSHIARHFINRIVIDKEGHVEIQWRI